MRKLLVGLAAAITFVVAGYFAFQLYVEHRIGREIEAALAPIRAAGGTASHGKISFDPPSRTVRIADIAGDMTAQPSLHFKVAGLTASGVGLADAGRFSAQTIEVSDIEASLQAGWALAYKAARITVHDYVGPAEGAQPLAGPTAADVYRLALRQFSDLTASSIEVPTQALEVKLPAASGGQALGYTYDYANVAVKGIKQGKIDAVTAERGAFSANIQQNGKAEKIAGEVAGLAIYDVDTAPVLAMFDPARANDDQYLRLYRQSTTGTYTTTLLGGQRLRMDGHTVDDFGVRPSRLQVPRLAAMIAAMPQPGSTPSPADAKDMMQNVADLYEGIRVGNAEMRGVTLDMPQGPLKFGNMHFNLENGKIGEFALEDLDVRSPLGAVKLERFGLKAFDLTNLMRLASRFLTPGQVASSDNWFAMMPLLEGAEIKGLVAPYKSTSKKVHVDTISLNWGRFVGPIPTMARLVAKFTTPIDPADPAQKQLVAAGLDTASINIDLGAAWTEGSGRFVLDPVTFDVGDVLQASARVALANVPREVFSTNPKQAADIATQIDAGPIELTLRDIGGVDLAVAQFARAQSVNREAARHVLVDSIKASVQGKTASADTVAVAEAVGRFIESPRGTLVLKLTPLGKVPALQLARQVQTDPFMALAQFRVEVSSGL